MPNLIMYPVSQGHITPGPGKLALRSQLHQYIHKFIFFTFCFTQEPDCFLKVTIQQ